MIIIIFEANNRCLLFLKKKSEKYKISLINILAVWKSTFRLIYVYEYCSLNMMKGKWSVTKKANIEIIMYGNLKERKKLKQNALAYNRLFESFQTHILNAVDCALYACDNNDDRNPFDHHKWLVQLTFFVLLSGFRLILKMYIHRNIMHHCTLVHGTLWVLFMFHFTAPQIAFISSIIVKRSWHIVQVLTPKAHRIEHIQPNEWLDTLNKLVRGTELTPSTFNILHNSILCYLRQFKSHFEVYSVRKSHTRVLNENNWKLNSEQLLSEFTILKIEHFLSLLSLLYN